MTSAGYDHLCINSDAAGGTGSPFTFLAAAGDAGFTRIMWGHQWNTDFLYDDAEIEFAGEFMTASGIKLSDTHGSAGKEKCWYSPVEYERRAGIALVKNRIRFTSLLGGSTVTLHPPVRRFPEEDLLLLRRRGLQSMHEIAEHAQLYGIMIALENLYQAAGEKDYALTSYDTIEEFFDSFPSLGFCWDPAHSIILGEKAAVRDEDLASRRLCMVHISDNRGMEDEHAPPFTWSTIWDHVARVIARSPYPQEKPVTLEVEMPPDLPLVAFLEDTRMKGLKFNRLWKQAYDEHLRMGVPCR